MRSQRAYGRTMDQVFSRAQKCSGEAWAANNYAAISPCYNEWAKWIEANDQPEPAWHMPWFVWTAVTR